MPMKFINILETSKLQIRGHYLDSVSYILLHFLTLWLFWQVINRAWCSSAEFLPVNESLELLFSIHATDVDMYFSVTVFLLLQPCLGNQAAGRFLILSCFYGLLILRSEQLASAGGGGLTEGLWICIYVWAHVCVCVCIYVYIYIYIYACICMCVYMCMHMYWLAPNNQ